MSTTTLLFFVMSNFGQTGCSQELRVLPPEHQILQGYDLVNNKFYVPIRLSNGYTTSIPVINHMLPQIEYRDCGSSVQLILNYRRGRRFGQAGDYGVIQYEAGSSEPKPCANPDPPPPLPLRPSVLPSPKPPVVDDRLDLLESKIEQLLRTANATPARPDGELKEIRAALEELKKQQQSLSSVVPLQSSMIKELKELRELSEGLKKPPAAPPQQLQSSVDTDEPLTTGPSKAAGKSPLVEDWMQPTVQTSALPE